MFTFSSSVNFGRVSLLPSACQVRILVYPGLNKLWPVVVNVSMPISNFIVVLIYLQSRANYRIQNGEKIYTHIMPAILFYLKVSQIIHRYQAYRSNKVSCYVIV